MKNIFLVIASFFLCGATLANQHDNRNVIAAPLVELSDPTLKPIYLSEITIDSQIISNIATSHYELTFYNPNNRILEGELVFSLFEGQSIIDYALQIKGKYRHASVIPKAQAKEAYEGTIRAKIDPALIEKTIGNNFKTRLYPIPANGYKKIKLTTQEILETVGTQYQFRIPLVTKEQLKKLKVSINLPSLKAKPTSNFNDFQFDSTSQGQLLNFEKTNARISKPIIIGINHSPQANSFVQKAGKQNYLFSSFRFTEKTQQPQRNLPKNIAIIWNTSFSNKARNIDKEMKFLNQYFQKVGNTKVKLVLLNNFAKQQDMGVICGYKVTCKNGHPFSFLRNKLKTIHFDGTSDYSKIDPNKLNVDEILMFSNGIKTIYSTDFANTNKPITIINSSIKSDNETLKRLAHLSNGRFINLSKYSVNTGFKQFLSSPIQIKIINTSNNIDKNNVFTSLQHNQINLFALTKNTSSAWIKLKIKQQNKATYQTIKIENPTLIKQNLASLWATNKIKKLSFNYKKNKKKIIDLAKNYKVLTNDMSLIILDRIEDYVRYEILPPPELRKQYSQLLKKKVDKKIYEKEQALIDSIKLLQEQKVWYQKDFPKTKPVAVTTKLKKAPTQVARPTALTNLAEAPQAAPAPAPRRLAIPRKAISEVENKLATPQNKKQAVITLKQFNPHAPYIKKIKQNKQSTWLESYHALKQEHVNQPMFYVDVADLFYKNGLKQEALVILSNLLELDFENSEFLRVFALKTMELGEYNQAIKAFEKVKELRPFEPQSFRDLALAYDKNKQSKKAANLLYHILTHTWDERFQGIKIVIINELNNILSKNKNLDKGKFDPRLISNLPVDLRIVINWSIDNTDIDLWVIDPYKEKTFYSNKVSRIGGKISNDITQGYGPEEFMIKEAVAGKYIIQADYFGNSQQKITIPVTIRAQIFSNFSTPNEAQKEIVLRLKNKKAVIDIGEYLYQ